MATCLNHQWEEEYYGYKCIYCGLFVPFGGEPWAADDEQVAKDEYQYNHGTCDMCGGEWGDGWSNCTCEEED